MNESLLAMSFESNGNVENGDTLDNGDNGNHVDTESETNSKGIARVAIIFTGIYLSFLQV